MAHMNNEQKQRLRDALNEGKTIQYNRPYWIDYDPSKPRYIIPSWLIKVCHFFAKKRDLEGDLADRDLEWQIKPPPQGINIDVGKEVKTLLKNEGFGHIKYKGNV